MVNPVNSQTHTDYHSRINTVLDYIEKNIDKDISLDELAAVSRFSKYHFSRIFDSMVGKTPFEFIKRVRLEKAASRLRIHPKQSVTRIALECGFNILEVFSSNFNNYFDQTPTGWQNSSSNNSNKSQIFGKATDYVRT